MKKSATQWLLELLPAIVQGVIAVEGTKNLAGQGAAKKALLVSVVHGAAAAGEVIPETHVQAYSAAVDRVAAVLYPSAPAGQGNGG